MEKRTDVEYLPNSYRWKKWGKNAIDGWIGVEQAPQFKTICKWLQVVYDDDDKRRYKVIAYYPVGGCVRVDVHFSTSSASSSSL